MNAGTGISGGSLTGPANVSVAASYRLPQGCGNGATAKSNGSGTWNCSIDAGTTPYNVGLGDVVAAGPTGDGCIDGSTFTSYTTNTASSKNLVMIPVAGRYRPVLAGSTRWFVNKNADLYDGETFAKGYVKMEIFKNVNNVETLVSTWARAEAENLDGGALPYEQEFTPFQADGTSKYFLRVTATGFACTTARILSPSIEFERVG